MGHYLGLALYAEGPTDYAFLQPLLHRVCDWVCRTSAIGVVEIAQVEALSAPATAKGGRGERIVASALEMEGAWNVLFIHSDGDGDWQSVIREQVEPAFLRLRQSAATSGRALVAVVPVREVEAWLLADPQALHDALGLRLEVSPFAPPARPAAVEQVSDPKAAVTALQALNPRRRRSSVLQRDLYTMMGETVSLERLASVPAFARFLEALKGELRDIGIIQR